MDLELIARTTAILLAGSAMAALLRRAAPSIRHLVWHLTIVLVLIAPLLISLAPNFAILPISSVPVVPGVPRATFGWVPSSSASALEPVSQQNAAFGTLGTIGRIGTVGSGAVLFWFGFCWVLSGVGVWRGSKSAPEIWVHEARAIGQRLGLKGRIDVRQSLKESSPHVAGAFQSIVLMPPSAITWTAEALQAAIALGASGDRRARTALIKATRDPDSQVREKAIAGLVLLGLRPSTGLGAPSSSEGRP